MTNKTENLCECGHEKRLHNLTITTGEYGFCSEVYNKMNKCLCKRFNPKKIGILELAKRIKDEDRELVKPKNHSQEKKDNNNGLSGVTKHEEGY